MNRFRDYPRGALSEKDSVINSTEVAIDCLKQQDYDGLRYVAKLIITNKAKKHIYQYQYQSVLEKAIKILDVDAVSILIEEYSKYKDKHNTIILY